MKALFLFAVLLASPLFAESDAPPVLPPADSDSVVKEEIAPPATTAAETTEKPVAPVETAESKPAPPPLMVSGPPSIPGLTASPAVTAAGEKVRVPAESDICKNNPMKVASLNIPSLSFDRIVLSSGKPRRLISYNLNLPCAATVTLTAQVDYQLVYCWNEFIGASTSRNCKGTGSNGQVQVRNLTYTALGFAPKDKQISEGFLSGILREASTKLFVNVSNSTDTFPGLTHSYNSQSSLPVTLVHSGNLAPGDYQIALDVYPDGLGDGNAIEKLHPINVLIVPD